MSSQVHHRSIESFGKEAASDCPWSQWTPEELMLWDGDESDGASLLYPPSLASSGMSSAQSSLETYITPEGFSSASPLSLRCHESDPETAHCISIIPDRKMRIASGDEINARILEVANPGAFGVNWSQWLPTSFQCKFCHERFLMKLQLQEHLHTHKQCRKELPRKKKQKRSQVCISSSMDSSGQISDCGVLPKVSTAQQEVVDDLSNLSLFTGEGKLHTDVNLPRLENTLSVSLASRNDGHMDRDGDSGIDFKDSTILEPAMISMKQRIMTRMMCEFMVIMEQDWTTQIQTHGLGAGSKPANGPTDTAGTHFGAACSSSDQKNRRGYGDDEERGESDDEDGDDDRRPPKRPRVSPSSESTLQDDPKFACPYRKHNPRKYCVREWRPCALTPLDTIARVKAHLYRHHRIFQCPRCKSLFPNQLVVDEHLMKLQGCEPSRISLAEGITTEIEKKLRSRKKTSRNQTDSDRWMEIYKTLFPTSISPNPYFEPVEEHAEQSLELQRLADLEDYTKRELPRVFWAALEEVVSTEMQPVEERLRSQLMSMFQGCQDRVFSTYESMLASNADLLGQGSSAGNQLSTVLEPQTRQNPNSHRSDDREISSSVTTTNTRSHKGSSSNLPAINSSSTLSSACKSSTTLNSIYSSTTTLSSIASSLATSPSQQIATKAPENQIGNSPWAVGPYDGTFATAARATGTSALPANFWSTDLEDLDISHLSSDILWDNEVPMEDNPQWFD